MPLDKVDDRPDEREDRGQRQVGGGATDLHADAARFDDTVVAGVDVGELLRGQGECDGPAFAGLEVDAPEPAQLPTGRATDASSSRTYSWTTSSPARVPVFVTSTRIVTASPGRVEVVRSSRRWSILNVVYESPCPNGQSGATDPST